MVSTMSVNVSPSTLFALMERLRETGSSIDPAEAVDAAIHQWLAATAGAPETAPRGYQWKTLFLPEGTWPRTAEPTAAATRDPATGRGWTEPERRKYRFRLEDVAFD